MVMTLNPTCAAFGESAILLSERVAPTLERLEARSDRIH